MPPASAAPRVLHLRSSCGFYGAEGVVYNLVRAYAGETVTVCLADFRDPHTELCDRLMAAGHPVAALPSRGAFDTGMLPRFAALLRKYRPDIVHTHEYKSDAIAWAVSRFRRVPLVATMHGVVRTTDALRRYEKLDAKALRRFDAVVGVSAGTADIARQDYGVPEQRVTLIPNGVDTDAFRPAQNRAAARAALGIPADGPLVGAVGRLSEEKGHAVLLDAVAQLGAAGRNAHVVFAGDGPLEAALKAQAAALGLTERTHFLGARDDVVRVYHALDVLALPSFTEGLPLTVIEAAACALPVVASHVGDVGRAVLDGHTGCLVPPHDARALADALSRLLSDPALRASFGLVARERAVEGFSARAMAASYETLYRHVLGRPAAPAPLLEAVR